MWDPNDRQVQKSNDDKKQGVMNHAPTNKYTRMKYAPDSHHRRSIRLKGYDYTQAGAYFVTICTQNRECLFGDTKDGEMRLNEHGEIAKKYWEDLSNHYSCIESDEFVIMPNHFHGIIVIVGAQFIAPFDCDAINQNKKHGAINHAPTVGEIVRAFKARCTHAINQIRNTQRCPVWQHDYYEHVIRSEEEMNRIRKYIVDNPAKWDEDENNPININRRGLICKGLINQTPTTTNTTNTAPTNISCPHNL